MAFYEWKWTKKDEFLQNLRDLLKPVILAEGYGLSTEDAGKQVFVRGERSITQKAKFFRGVSNEELRSATRLTVAYVLTPSKTCARFTWENPYYLRDYEYEQRVLDRQALEEANRFYEYLEDWYKAVAQSDEKADPPPLEGREGSD